MAGVFGWSDDPDLDWDPGWKTRWRAWIGRDSDVPTEDGAELDDDGIGADGDHLDVDDDMFDLD